MSVLLFLPAAAWLLWAGRRAPRRPAWRTWSGLAGLAALAAASATPDATLPGHMAAHLLLQALAAPLLVAAAPVRLVLATLGRDGRRAVGRLLGSRPVRALGHPAVALALFAAVLGAVHVPATYDLAARSPAAHAAVHGALFWSAVLLWVPVLGADPAAHRLSAVGRVAVVVGAMAAMSAVGAVLAAAPEALYAAYPDPAGQQLAGGLMWIGGMVAVLPLLVAAAWQALAAEERRQRAREARW